MPKSTNPLIRRKTKSPITRKSKLAKASLAEREDERLDDTGLVPSLSPGGVSQNVESLVRYIHAHTWTPMPDRAGGMNSQRIGEVLRFRASLPRIISLAHLHALSASSTSTERELARLFSQAAVRKVVIPGRGKGGAVVGEGVILAEDWKSRLRAEQGLSDGVKEKYLQLLDAYPTSATAPMSTFSESEVRELVGVGFFTSPSALSSNLGNLFAPPGSSSLSNAGFQAATGTLAAIGGSGAIQDSGGGGSALATSSTRSSSNKVHGKALQYMTFSLPATGAYLKLLTSARTHLLALLTQISPRYKESTRDLLREKWDGNLLTSASGTASSARGVLPGKTKKWREFYGLDFDFVLAECVGSGLAELFDTGSVGIGVRGIS